MGRDQVNYLGNQGGLDPGLGQGSEDQVIKDGVEADNGVGWMVADESK